MARAGIITPTPLATPEEVATYRRTTAAALARERYKGNGPKYKKLSGRIYYDWDDVIGVGRIKHRDSAPTIRAATTSA